jgi:uncharacterized membrane protein
MSAVNFNLSSLSSVPFLEGLHPDDLHALAPRIETHHYEKGETLFLMGDKGGALLIVVSGAVELFIYDENESRIVLSTVTVGGFFGEVSLFDDGLRTTNAMATEETDVLVLRQEVIVDFLRKHPDAAIHMISVLSRRLRDNTNLLVGGKTKKAYDLLREQRSSNWDRIADEASRIVGSWRYLAALAVLVVLWMSLNVTQLIGPWDRPFEFNVLNLTITILGAIQVPLILMAQRRQDDYSKIAADLEYEVNLKSQLSVLEVHRKLEWLRESMLDQTARLERLETDYLSKREKSTATTPPN